MPPKSSAGKEKLTDEDDVLQAVILADSFNKRFKPLTVGKPRCLLPVCNATLLDWTFESLSLAGVQEIFVICRSYPDLVKAAIRDSKWSNPMYGLKIVPIITSKETFTPGDAMRDIYTRGIITSDFVLVMGDLVSNVRIDEVVRVHKERRRTNKDAIMTMCVKESGAVHRSRSQGESAVFVLDANTSECLHYESVTGYPPKKVAQIPREIFKEHPEVEVRYDLIDCCIDVCSVEVPSLFQDNFDYGDIRRDFVHGVLTSDLLMKNIHCYVLKEGYAARVADTRSYDAVSKDILARWTFPLVPDDNHPGGHSYEHLRGNKYIAKGNSVSLSRTCKIGTNCLIGAGTTISDNASIQASVIGRNCFIAPNVVLKNVYIFDGTTIGEGGVIEECIIGANVTIKEGSRIDRGSLVGDGVVLGKNARLGPFDRVSKRREVLKKALNGSGKEHDESEDDEDEDSELEDVEAHQDDVSVMIGEGSNAIVWPQGPREDDEDIDEVERYYNQRLMRLGDTCSDMELEPEDDSVADDIDSDSDSDSDDSLHSNALSAVSSATSYSSPATGAAAIHALQETAAQEEFQYEVSQSLERAFAEGHSVDNAAVELKTLRMASNVDLKKVREAVVKAIVEKIQVVEEGGAKQRTEIASVVKRWGALIDKIGGVDAVETVEVLQYNCAQSARLPLFGQILAALYQEDIVDEDDIRAWHATPIAKGETLQAGTTLEENVKRCWAVGSKMIEQFDEQESSEEEDSGEEADQSEGEKAAVIPATVEEEEEEISEEEEEGDTEAEADVKTTQVATASQSAPPKPTEPTSKAAAAAAAESSEEESDEEDESEEEQTTASGTTPASVSVPDGTAKTATPQTSSASQLSAPVTVLQAKEDEEESEEEQESEEEESEDEPAPTAAAAPTPAATPLAPVAPEPAAAAPVASQESSEEEDEDEEESEEEESDVEPVPPSVYTASAEAKGTSPASAQPQILAATTPAVADEESDEGEDESDEEEDATSAIEAQPVTQTTPSTSAPGVSHPTTTDVSAAAPPKPPVERSEEEDDEEDEDEDEDSDEEVDDDEAVVTSVATLTPATTATATASLPAAALSSVPIAATPSSSTQTVPTVPSTSAPIANVLEEGSDEDEDEYDDEDDEEEDDEDEEDEDEDEEDENQTAPTDTKPPPPPPAASGPSQPSSSAPAPTQPAPKTDTSDDESEEGSEEEEDEAEAEEPSSQADETNTTTPTVAHEAAPLVKTTLDTVAESSSEDDEDEDLDVTVAKIQPPAVAGVVLAEANASRETITAPAHTRDGSGSSNPGSQNRAQDQPSTDLTMSEASGSVSGSGSDVYTTSEDEDSDSEDVSSKVPTTTSTSVSTLSTPQPPAAIPKSLLTIPTPRFDTASQPSPTTSGTTSASASATGSIGSSRGSLLSSQNSVQFQDSNGTKAYSSHQRTLQPDLLSPQSRSSSQEQLTVPAARPRPRKHDVSGEKDQNRRSGNRLSALFLQGGALHLNGHRSSPLSPNGNGYYHREKSPEKSPERGQLRDKAKDFGGRMGKMVKRVVSMTSLRKGATGATATKSPTDPSRALGVAADSRSPTTSSPLARRFRRGKSEPPEER